MWIALLIGAMLVFAIQAIRAKRLLHSAIWLAGASALLSIMFYRFGAYYVAVIELSVGAGLVTVLFVFAVGIAGEELLDLKPLVPRPITWVLVSVILFLLGYFILSFDYKNDLPQTEQSIVSAVQTSDTDPEAPIQIVIWEERGLDVLAQIVLIFSGVMGLLGLLAEAKSPLQKPMAEEVAARRERELLDLEERFAQKEKELA